MGGTGGGEGRHKNAFTGDQYGSIVTAGYNCITQVPVIGLWVVRYLNEMPAVGCGTRVRRLERGYDHEPQAQRLFLD